MSHQQDGSNQGRIPFRLRIGVTGHLRLADEAVLGEQVRRVLQRLKELAPPSPCTQILFTVVSALAEGADRLVVREALRQGAGVEADLPARRDEYVRDFESDESKREFDALLAEAKVVTELPSSTGRQEAYQRIGRHLVDRCDVLIALWDGEPPRGQGGTAEIVAYARERRVPLIWIRTKDPHEIIEELGSGLDKASFRRLDEYNRGKIAQERFEREVDRQRSELLAAARRSGVKTLLVQALSGWVLPYFVRADVLAERYQTGFYALGTALFLLAAAAVAAGASHSLLAPDTPRLAFIEAGLMLGLLLVVALGRWWRLRDRWVSYRFLAERFRSGLFLASVGLDAGREGVMAPIYLGHPPQEWLRLAFREVWNRRPQVEERESSAEGLGRFLADAWIGDQIKNHLRTSRRQERRHLQLTWAANVVFAAAVLAALLGSFDLGGDVSAGRVSLGEILIILAISLPALGAALSAVRAQREYQRNAERYGRMAYYLEAVRACMETARDLETIRARAAEAEDLMLEENRDWFGAMQFHDLELRV